MVIKSDQEPSIKALAEAVQNSFAAQYGVRVQRENSPKGDDHGKSNGEAEAAVEITQGLCRTYKHTCEKGLGERINPKPPLVDLWVGSLSMLVGGTRCSPTTRT